MNTIYGKLEPFIQTSMSLLDSEELIDKTYSGMLAIMQMMEGLKMDRTVKIGLSVSGGYSNNTGKNQKNLHTSKTNRLISIFDAVGDGIYFPAIKRNYLCGYVDLKNDILPEKGTVVVQPFWNEFFSWATIEKKKEFTKEHCIIPVPKENIHSCYLINWIRVPLKKDLINVHQSFFIITINGHIVPCYSKNELRKRPQSAVRLDNFNCYNFASGVIGLLNDRKYLWLAEASENISGMYNAKVQFGIDAEMTKSLFYARSEPLTELGRKKPILHWVMAHERRIKKGVDIDIMKHLRGVEEFEMGNINFKIIQPTKKDSKV